MPPIDTRLVALCGSETRLRTLGVLANSFGPLTGYRVGRTAGVSLPKVYRELKRLRSAGLVRLGPKGWILSDPDVGVLLRKRFRISWSRDWFDGIARRSTSDAGILDELRRLPPPRFPKGWRPRDPTRFARDPEKDQLLARLGLESSLHG